MKIKSYSLIALSILCSSLFADFRLPTKALEGQKRAASYGKKPKKHIEIPRKPVKRKGLQCYTKHRTFSEWDLEELLVNIKKEVASRNWDIVCKYLERAITLCDDVSQRAGLIVQLADVFYDQGNYEEAAKRYSEFAFMYPGNKQLEYANYKSILCAHKQILSIDRDQTQTQTALELAEKFLKREDSFVTYRKEVEKIQRECKELLAQADCNVAHFYIKQGSYKAAERRLSTVRNEWLEPVPQIAATLAQLEVNLAEVYKEFKVPEASEKVVQLTKPAPTAEIKKDMVTRF